MKFLSKTALVKTLSFKNLPLKSLSAAVLTGAMAMSAMAVPTPVQPPQPQANPVQRTPEQAQQRADRMAKFEAEKAALFQQADGNKDGKLSAAEFGKFKELQKNAWQARKQDAEKNRFARLDSNKDGALSLQELNAPHAQRAGFKHHRDGAAPAPKPML